MNAIRWIAAQEALSAARNRTFRAIAVIIAGLLLVSFLVEARHHTSSASLREELQARATREWRAQPDRHPHQAAHHGDFAFRPPGALSFFDPGLERYAGAVTFLEPHQRNLSGFSEAFESSELALFGSPSAAFVLQTLAPLLLFCITFSSVAGEREAGIWSLLLAQGTPARTLLFGKVLGALVLVLACVLPILGVGFASGWLLGALHPTWDTLLRAALLLGGYVVYLALCAVLGVIVSALHRRAQSALLTLLALWAALWVVVPRLVTASATELRPVPLRAQLELDIARATRDLGDSHDPENPQFAELKRRTLARYGVTRVQDLPVNYAGVVMTEAERRSSQVYDAYHQKLDAAYRAQDSLALRLGMFAPLLAMRSFSMAMAGTDGRQLADYEAKVEAHRYKFIQRLNELQTTNPGWQNHGMQRVSRAAWQQFPPFEYHRPAASWALRQARPAALGLLAWAGLSLMLTWFLPQALGER